MSVEPTGVHAGATAAEIIAALGLIPHPEGGHYTETFRDAPDGGRGHSTAIYYLLEAGQVSGWHRIDAAEVWHWYAGDPLELSVVDAGGTVAPVILSGDILKGHRPQFVVAPRQWQSAQSLGQWSLVGCTVAPGFQFEGFELAPDGWTP